MSRERIWLKVLRGKRGAAMTKGTQAVRGALEHVAREFHTLHRVVPYDMQAFERCEHGICIEAREALARAAEPNTVKPSGEGAMREALEKLETLSYCDDFEGPLPVYRQTDVLALIESNAQAAATRQPAPRPGWMIFTADHSWKFVGEAEPPRLEGETGRVRFNFALEQPAPTRAELHERLEVEFEKVFSVLNGGEYERFAMHTLLPICSGVLRDVLDGQPAAEPHGK